MVQDITFNSGEISRTFVVDILNDTIAESDESFEVFLKLTPDSSGARIGEPSVATGTIFDDEIPSKTFTVGLFLILLPYILFFYHNSCSIIE